jgi:hypothetical protein
LEVFERRPQAAEIAAPFVTGRHPKTFTETDIRTAANNLAIRSRRRRAGWSVG